MQQKEIILINKGMNRDLSVSKVDGSAAYDNRNIRLIATDKDTLLSVTNERGNKKVNDVSFVGTLVGYGVLNDYVILFTVENTADENGKAISTSYIYRVRYENDTFSSIVIFKGALGFSADHPIETIVDYETEDIQKIYWIDGLHVLRFLNFSDTYLAKHLIPGYTLAEPVFDFADDTTWFDSTRSSVVIPNVAIVKDNSGNTRANGVVQYFLTYYNKNGQQTGIVYSSPLVYLAPEGRGGAADQTNNNKVTLTVSGLDTTFEYVRLYNIIRTSQDGQVTGSIVAESTVSTAGTAAFVDDGAHYTSVDPASFLFLGSSDAKFGTMTQKDGTLFLGNIISAGNDGVDNLEDVIKQNAFVLSGDEFVSGIDWESALVKFEYSTSASLTNPKSNIPYVSADGYYPYESQLNYTNSQITTFKGGEKYRFALRFIKSNGVQSKSFWIGDKVNSLYPKITSYSDIQRALAVCYIPLAIVDAAKKLGYISVKLMIAQASYSDRSVQAQGIVCPTVFNLYDRTNGGVFTKASWFYRMRNGRLSSTHFSVLGNANTEAGEVQCNWWETGSNTPYPLYRLKDGKISSAPASYKLYTVIEQVVFITRSGANGARRDITFTCLYYTDESATKHSDAFLRTASNKKKADCVTLWQQWEEEAGVPVAFRASADTIEKYVQDRGTYQPGKQAISSAANPNLQFSLAERQYHFIDENVVTLNSPEFTYNAVSLDRADLSFRLVGISRMTAGTADYTIESENREYAGQYLDAYDFTATNVSNTDSTLSAWPLYSEFGYQLDADAETETYEKVDTTYHYMMYPWHKSGSIPNFGDAEKSWSVLFKKRFANLHYSRYTIYNNYGENEWSVSPDDIRQLPAAAASLYTITADERSTVYSGNVDDIILSPVLFKYPIYYSRNYADNFPNLNQLEYVDGKQTSDSVRLTYNSGAHAVISLPTTGARHTLLPYFSDESAFELPELETGETGPYTPWSSSLSASSLGMIRIVDMTDSAKLNDITQGAISAGFGILYNSGSTLTAQAPGDEYLFTFFKALQKKAADNSSSSLYVHLTTTDSVTRLVDILTMKYCTVTVSYSWEGAQTGYGYSGPAIYNGLKVTFKSTVPMTNLDVNFYIEQSSAQPYRTYTETLDNKTSTFVYFPLNFAVTYGSHPLLSFEAQFAPTYTDGSDGSKHTIIPALSKQNIAISTLADTSTEYLHSAYLAGANYIDPTANKDTYTFVNFGVSPTQLITLDTSHRFVAGNLLYDRYKVSQSTFKLSDTDFYEEGAPYMFVGELYKDYDALAKQDPALDTRYGGITESAVEGNTFVEASTALSLEAVTDIASNKVATLTGEQIKNAILNKQQGLTFVIGLYSKSNNPLEIMNYTSLTSLTLADLLPTSSSPASGLTLYHDSELNVWGSKLDGLSDAEINAITNSTEYKIVLLRYGYARRGKRRYYTAKNTGIAQWSHTSRQAAFKFQRGGKRMRIIGYDILYSGKTVDEMKHSSTWREHPAVGDYTQCTLVSSLGAELSLPGIRNDAITADGRYSEKAKNGIIDLYIGLYHREGSEWKLVSNLVQVRGRSDDYKQIWEFDRSNIAYTATKGE